VISGENEGRHNADEQPADSSSRGDHEIERCEISGIGLEAHQFAVAEHAHAEQSGEGQADVELKPIEHGLAAQFMRIDDGRYEDQQQRQRSRSRPVPTFVVEADDERKQIKAQRRNAEKRHGRSVLTRETRCRQEGRRGQRGKHEPQNAVAPAWRRDLQLAAARPSRRFRICRERGWRRRGGGGG
jgi:hypothetical protein